MITFTLIGYKRNSTTLLWERAFVSEPTFGTLYRTFNLTEIRNLMCGEKVYVEDKLYRLLNDRGDVNQKINAKTATIKDRHFTVRYENGNVVERGAFPDGASDLDVEQHIFAEHGCVATIYMRFEPID